MLFGGWLAAGLESCDDPWSVLVLLLSALAMSSAAVLALIRHNEDWRGWVKVLVAALVAIVAAAAWLFVGGVIWLSIALDKCL